MRAVVKASDGLSEEDGLRRIGNAGSQTGEQGSGAARRRTGTKDLSEFLPCRSGEPVTFGVPY